MLGYRNGAALRLSDVANVTDSVENIRAGGLTNGKPAVLVIVFREPGANIIETVDRVRALVPQLRASLPPAIQLSIAQDRTTTIRASVRDVGRTMAVSIGLVIFVVFVFLRSARATAIPAVAVPVSLIGTCGVMYLLGYSLNNLSLMALTIATGFVVDDAIVVVENISRHLESGMSPAEAARHGASEIGFTVVSISLSLVAVFIPILLMGGIVGRLFREVAVTLTAAIMVSMVVSLTTTPMMCARLLPFRKIAIARPDPRTERARLRVGARALRTGASRRSPPSARDAAPDARDYGGDCLSLPADSERILPAAGYGEPGRVHSGRSIDIVPGHAAAGRSVR